MDTDELGLPLDSLGSIRHACDLDLLLFFNRHPRALLTVEQLVRLGYAYQPVAKSIEAMSAAVLLAQFTISSGAMRLDVLDLRGVQRGYLSSLAKNRGRARGPSRSDTAAAAPTRSGASTFKSVHSRLMPESRNSRRSNHGRV